MRTNKYGGLTRNEWRAHIAAGEKFHGTKFSMCAAIMELADELGDMEDAYDDLVKQLQLEGP